MSEAVRARLNMVFGTGDAAPASAGVEQFYHHAALLSADVPVHLQTELRGLPHDFSGGSDHLVFVDGMLLQCAAEVWAASAIFRSQLALLTIFHHARALFEMHAFAYWLFKDFDARARRALREHLMQRDAFERHFVGHHGPQPSDITQEGRVLIANHAVKAPPSVYDQLRGNAVLERDFPLFWKFASTFVHPFQSRTAAVTADGERAIMENILVGTIRHAAGVYREVSTHFGLTHEAALKALKEAEVWSV